MGVSMKICEKCGKKFKITIIIDGKKRNLCSRLYCLECSPWGMHNNKNFEKCAKLDSNGKRIYAERTCPSCGKKHCHRGHYCHLCNFNKRSKTIGERVKSLVGNECWVCGYNKTKKNLCFHHVDPSKKSFGLDMRSIQKTNWENVLEEMKKCILVCHNCHGEIHYDILTEKEVIKAFDRWGKISEKI
jgi:hypothetical protein